MCESEGAARYKASKVAEDEFLDYIASYRRRYNSLYARGPLLLLTPENEDGRMVSVVSLVVPSRVPHPQLLLMQDAARVLSDMITYTPPQPPPSLPTRVRSPAVVVKAQEGSGAECALVVASVLLGAGYHALVVQGSAQPTLVARDTSHLPCPYLEHQQEEGGEQEEVTSSKYSVRSPPDLRSHYALIMEERARRRRTAQLQQQQQQQEGDIEDIQTLEARVNSSGDYTEAHLHFWVVVLPPGRGVTTPTFIESTTGQVLSLSSSLALPYLYIHALFNHTNYWACTKYNQAISCDMFDLSDRSVWMPLMDDGVGAAKASQAPHHPTHQDNKNQNNQQYSHHTPPSHSREKVGDSQYITTSSLMASGTKHALKVPTTWATPIIITEEALIERFPGGWREEVYSGVVVRHYSPFSHPRGATLIFTFFSKSGSVKEVWEKYEQREDGLVSCVTDLLQGTIVETFANTRKDTLKRHQYWRAPASLAARARRDGMDNPAQAAEVDDHNHVPGEEVFMFYSRFRVDALRSRVIGETTWREEYDERPDLLLARTVTFGNSDPTPPRSIQRIEEEFGCPDNMEPHKVVQRRVFQVSESKILLVYHYGRHRLLQPTRSFLKPQNGSSTALTPDMTQGFQPDPSVEEPAMPQLWAVLEAEMEAELRVQEEVRRGVEETAALRTARANEEHHIVLLPHMFDIQRNETVQYILKQRKFKEEHREEAHRKRQEEREGRVDTISPYLPLLLDDSERDIGEMVRERCLQDLRERLALRANLLQDRLDQARAVVLECREEAGRRKRLAAEERAALTTRTTTAEAAHRRLRAQLAAWRHEASERYETLAVQLENDLRLNQPGSARRTSTNTTTSNTHTS